MFSKILLYKIIINQNILICEILLFIIYVQTPIYMVWYIYVEDYMVLSLKIVNKTHDSLSVQSCDCVWVYTNSVLMWFPDSLPPVAECVVCVSARCFQRNGVSAVLNAARLLLLLLSAGVTTHLVHLQKSNTHCHTHRRVHNRG